mmetsp:Transcript_55841/g.147624  ORF Transcript_55841/g.147624 Transcript_55841/m.147624 type:complete len:312 (-) Transcript_55841:49-984(-)
MHPDALFEIFELPPGLAVKCEVRVSLQSPHYVLRAGEALCRLLGFASGDVVGRSIQAFCGAETDVSLLHTCILQSAMQLSTCAQLRLKGADGAHRSLTCHFRPFEHCGELLGCTISLCQSSTASISQVLKVTSYATVLVSAQPPHVILNANDQFSHVFSLDAPDADGVCLASVLGSRSSPDDFLRLVYSAAAGQPAEGTVYTRTRFCDDFPWRARAVPVAARPNDRLLSIALVFFPLMPPEDYALFQALADGADLFSPPDACLADDLPLPPHARLAPCGPSKRAHSSSSSSSRSSPLRLASPFSDEEAGGH